jgi:hypothetical protein
MAALETAEETSASGQEIRSAAESARDQVSSASAKALDALETAQMTAAKVQERRFRRTDSWALDQRCERESV